MAGHSFEALFAPISPDSPCGPDLEVEGDAEFMRFQAQVEGLLPASFYSFDRREAGLGSYIGFAGALLKRSADIRVATALAKLTILDGDLGGFAACMTGIADWLNERWPGVYPALLDGDPVLRLIDLRSLDDNPHTILPLQAAALFRTRRLGAVSLRSFLLSEGSIQPRSGFEDDDNAERVPSAAEIAGAVREADAAEIMATRAYAHQIAAALDAIEAAVDQQTGQFGALRLGGLKTACKQLVSYIDKAATIKDPSLFVSEDVGAFDEAAQDSATGCGIAPQPGDAGLVTSAATMVMALQASARYFAMQEPSSPVRMLLAQAEALIGKSFFDALSALAPDIAGQAMIQPAPSLALMLPLERLAQLLPEIESHGNEAASEDDGWGVSKTSPKDEGANSKASDEIKRGEDVAVDGSVDTDDLRQDAEEATTRYDAPNWSHESGARTGLPVFIAKTRHEALLLLGNVSEFLRASEPSSPIPFILDHAKSMAGQDFLTLLRTVLPAKSLSVDED